MMERMPKPFEQYRHFKGGRYQILCVAEREDTGEQLVIYQALYGDGKIWARNLEEFTSEVDHEKYPDVKQRWRFERILPPEGNGTEPEDEPEQIRRPVSSLQEENAASEAGDDGSEVLDPQVERFLDAQTAEERLTILSGMRNSITDDMIDTMAMAVGVEVEPGPVSVRYEDLRDCLITIDRYELERGRLRR